MATLKVKRPAIENVTLEMTEREARDLLACLAQSFPVGVSYNIYRQLKQGLGD